MKKMIIIVGSIILIGVVTKFILDTVFKRSIACVTVKVIDVQNNPILGAKAGLTLALPKSSNPWDGTVSYHKKGITNSKGECTLIGKGLNEIIVYAVTDGYYPSSTTYKFKKTKWIFKQPWNRTIEVMLRKKGNLIPLYVKHNVNLKMNKQNFSYGYDFFMGDWVTPYGSGTNADINVEFKCDRKDVYNYIWEVEVSMVSTNDGFVEILENKGVYRSKFEPPYNAPRQGYRSHLLFHKESINGTKNLNTFTSESNDYFFRIKTKYDQHGKMNCSYFGKLIDLNCTVDKKNVGYISFLFYYLNPVPNDNNLEWSGSNLFQNLD